MTESPEASCLGARQCLPPVPPVRSPKVRLPDDACDTHSHVFGPVADYPLDPARGYTPALVTIDDYRQVMAAFGIERAVLVQPSVYGFDNRLLLDTLAALPDMFRGVAVMSPDAPEDEFAEAHRFGVRGIRVNPRNPAGMGLKEVPRLAERLAPYGGHIELHVTIDEIGDLAGIVAGLPVPVVFDHFGYPDLRAGPRARAFSALIDLAVAGLSFVKLSGSYRLTGGTVSDARLTPFVERLVREAPGALLWGLDWPHTEFFDAVPDSASIVDLTAEWFTTQDLARQVLCRNPRRLYWAD